jgi:hypothetical protein
MHRERDSCEDGECPDHEYGAAMAYEKAVDSFHGGDR